MRTRKHYWADELEDDPSLTQGCKTLQRIVYLTKRSGVSLDALDDISKKIPNINSILLYKGF